MPRSRGSRSRRPARAGRPGRCCSPRPPRQSTAPPSRPPPTIACASSGSRAAGWQRCTWMSEPRTLEPRRLEPSVWEVPVGYVEGMRVPGVVYASEPLFQHALADRAVEQVANVATLPGIVRAAYAMPDIHWGYGFPIGGGAAPDVDQGGGVSPGGVGHDIRCGGRLLRSDPR